MRRSVAFLTGCFIAAVLAQSCRREEKKPHEEAAKPVPEFYNQYKDANLTVEVYKIDSIEHRSTRGWGYDILNNGKPIIHQPYIPSIMGNNGFSSEEKAQRTGEFVIGKIRNNILPPAVTPEELDSLGVLD